MKSSGFIQKSKAEIRIVSKPWGEEHWFAYDNDKYVGKVFWVRKGHRLSLAYHSIKDETIYLSKGKAEVYLEDEDGNPLKIILEAGEALRIRPGTKHRLGALEDVEVIEVSTPELEDHVRIEDDYGRLDTKKG